MEAVKIADIKDDHLIIKYHGKKVRINITEELQIKESVVNSQLKDSPSSYAFLCSLKDQAIKERDELERKKDRIFSELWLFFKNSNSKLTNDYATHQATQNKRFIAAEDKYLKAAYKASRLLSICKSYESRENILRTISANIRSER